MSQKNLTQCSHCGNRAPHQELHSVTVVDEIEVEERSYDYPVEYKLWQCSTCDGVSLYFVTPDDGGQGEEYFDFATLAYPDEKKFEHIVPDPVRRSYIEAKKVKKVSPYAFAVLIRRSLEQICVDKIAAGSSLKEKIKDLASKNIIPSNLASMADTLRSLGNVGAHAVDYQFDWKEVQAMDDFLVAVIEYVYVAPHKVQSLMESMEQKHQAKNKQPTRASSKKDDELTIEDIPF